MGWTTGTQFPEREMMGFFPSPPPPDWHWGPLSLLSNEYWKNSDGKAAGA